MKAFGKRAAVVASVVTVTLLMSTVPAWSDADYHHERVTPTNSSATKKGIWYAVEVTNPAVPWAAAPPADHFVAPTWMSEPGTSNNCPGSSGWRQFMEVGWGERGDINVGGTRQRFIYQFDTLTCPAWYIVPGVELAVGDHVEFLMQPLTTCTVGSGSCTWFFYYKINTGLWVQFRSQTMFVGNDLHPHVGAEVQNKISGNHWSIAADGSVNFNATYFYHTSDAQWYLWTSGELPAYYSYVSPYGVIPGGGSFNYWYWWATSP